MPVDYTSALPLLTHKHELDLHKIGLGSRFAAGQANRVRSLGPIESRFLRSLHARARQCKVSTGALSSCSMPDSGFGLRQN